MAAVVSFETYESVNEVIDELLSHYRVDHASYLVPVNERWNVGYFLQILRHHQPRIVFSSWDRIGWQMVAAAKNIRPKPEVWLFTGNDIEVLMMQGALVYVDRVFEKPLDGSTAAREIVKFLGIAEPTLA